MDEMMRSRVISSHTPPVPVRQSGFALIEVMAAALVFLLGVVGLLGFNARMIQDSVESRYVARANFLLNEYINQLAGVAGKANPAADVSAFQSGGANFAAFQARVQRELPSANVTVDIAFVAATSCTLINRIAVTFTVPGMVSARTVWAGGFPASFPAKGAC